MSARRAGRRSLLFPWRQGGVWREGGGRGGGGAGYQPFFPGLLEILLGHLSAGGLDVGGLVAVHEDPERVAPSERIDRLFSKLRTRLLT